MTDRPQIDDQPARSTIDPLQEVVRDACGEDSMGLSPYVEVLRVLAEHGRCRIVRERGGG